MTDNTIQLDHIALHVTNLDRSIRFYQEILHMQVCGPVNLGTLSTSGRLIGKAVGGKQGILQGIVGGLSSRALHDQYTDVALLSTGNGKYEILLVQERYPETNATRSVDGNTIFGFSFTLTPAINTEILAWDLHQAGATFEWGDPEKDGTIFSSDCPAHSLYITDPDGRIIELKPGTEPSSSPFITGLDTITLHATYPDQSKSFYTDKLLLSFDSDSANSIPGKRFIWLKNSVGKKCILLYGQTKPDGNPVPAGGFGLDHYALTGCSSKGEKPASIADVKMDPEHLSENTGSSYIRDQDGFWIECYQK